MADKKHAAVCGVYCRECHFLNEGCTGCGHVQGQPFWTVELIPPVCPLYDCCINRKKLEHCGLCSELPCQAFLSLRDPLLSEKEFAASLRKRLDELQRRRQIGTVLWLAGKQK